MNAQTSSRRQFALGCSVPNIQFSHCQKWSMWCGCPMRGEWGWKNVGASEIDILVIGCLSVATVTQLTGCRQTPTNNRLRSCEGACVFITHLDVNHIAKHINLDWDEMFRWRRPCRFGAKLTVIVVSPTIRICINREHTRMTVTYGKDRGFVRERKEDLGRTILVVCRPVTQVSTVLPPTVHRPFGG